jgi:thiol-disulfide isomerase/thioredoxin
LARLYEETRKTGLAILSTDVSDDPKTAQGYLLKMGHKGPNFHDDGEVEVESAFGTQGVPRSILIDPDGKITLDALALPPSKSERRSRILALNMPQL